MLSDLVKRRRASSIAEVVEIMTLIEGALPRTDGVWWFNHLYLRVTLAVRGAMGTTTFRDQAFLERLDVMFANLYFDAWPLATRARALHRRRGVRSSSAVINATSCRCSSRLPA
jgi:hypothetical protein